MAKSLPVLLLCLAAVPGLVRAGGDKGLLGGEIRRHRPQVGQ